MLKLENISKQYIDPLFDHVTFILGNKEKVGLVGLNGCGKSTLLKIIAGIERADTGRVEVVNERLGYLAQEFSFDQDLLVGEFFESLIDDPHSEMYKIDIILSRLNLSGIDHYQYVKNLSEGQKMKLKLVELLIKEPTILLLDEPTNHLDIKGIIWFEEFIKNFEGICIVISHDREFLNHVTDHIFEIDEQKLLVFEGNYDDFLLGKAKYIENRAKEFTAFERKKKQLEQLLDHARAVKSARKRGKAVKAAKTRFRREVEERRVEEYEERRLSEFKIDGYVHKHKNIIEVDDISFAYQRGKNIINGSSLSIYGSEKIWFFGANGIGKTTFIKLLMGDLKSVGGEIRWGENIDWTYFSQDQTHLDMEETVENFFIENAKIPYERSFGVLEKFLFPKEYRTAKLKMLSPGERARLSFAVFAQHSYDFLILDEPTNHLDVKTKEVIEDSLREFKGAVLLISHDRYFVRSVGVDRVITLKKGVIVEEEGT
ncbi:ABC-F family ATP-binding cassette domain-containing protein [Candidatus Dojkabacteria bacterium]|nr:ABC-F family ATP-binding cassette domain-containing protein [Candidatus Dojkabacteria bacterium]